MKSFDDVIKQTEEFLAMAQAKSSAQPSEIQAALQKAGLWDLSKEVADLLVKSKVADNVSVQLFILVSQGPKVNFSAILSPFAPFNVVASQKLQSLLKGKYANIFASTIKAAKLDVVNPIKLSWLNF